MPGTENPIVVLDSGLGGLTVVRALHAAMPLEQIVYFGDTARLPYGSKSSATVSAFVHQIITFLYPLNPKHVVLACNTATALALPAVRSTFPELTITGVIEPGARSAVVAAGSRQQPTIGIIATEATIRSQAYERAIHRRRHYARLLLRPTPLLVPIIEEGRDGSDPLVRLALRQYLVPMFEKGIHVLVLGCTHYPILRPMIEELAGPGIPVIDSATQCAEDVRARLASAGLMRGVSNVQSNGAPWLRCFVTDDSPRFEFLATRFLGEFVGKPTWVSPEQLYETHAPSTMRRAV